MSDLLREAEEEIRRETIEGSAKKFAPVFIGVLVLALVGGGAFQIWRNMEEKGLEKASGQYYAAMEKLQANDLDGGIKALEELSKTAPKGFASLAAIQRASVLQEKGDDAAALAAFDEAAKIANSKEMKQIAQLRAAYLAANLETKEKALARIEPLIADKGAYAFLARELKAAIAWQNGDNAGAKNEYQLLQADPSTPQGLRARAGQAIAIIDSGAAPAADLLQMPTQNPNAQGQISQEQAMQMAKAQAAAQAAAQAQAAQGTGQALPKGVEIGPDGKRIVRLPPGVKLPPGTKIPDNVRVIETPLPAAEIAKLKKQQEAQIKANETKAKADLQKQIEAERAKAMKAQEDLTKAQQQKVDEITKANQGEIKPVEEKKGE